jgi:hypothetical protein
MNPIRKQVYLTLLGVVALTLGLIAFFLKRDIEYHLLAALGVILAVAVIVGSLPVGEK